MQKGNIHYAFIVLLSCCVIGFSTLATVANCMGSFMPVVVRELETTNTAFALYFTFLNITLMICQPLAQLAMKRFDIRICTSAAVTLSCLAVVLMSRYSTITGWYFSAVLNGLGLSVITYLLFPVILGNWFKKRIGTVLGIASCMSGLGGALWTAFVGNWITSYGYQNAYLICAAIGWFTAMPFCIFGLRNHPADKGLEPYGAEEMKQSAGEENISLPENNGYTAKEAICTPYFYMLLIAVLCIHFMGTFQNQITNFAASIGFPIERATVLSSCLLFGAVAGKIGLGWIHDKFGIAVTWITAVCASLLALALFLFGGSIRVIVFTGGFIFGFGYALMGIGSPLLIRDTLGTRDYAAIYSYVIALGTAVNALAPLVYSGIYDATGSYFYGLYICAAGLVISLAAALRLIQKVKGFSIKN